MRDTLGVYMIALGEGLRILRASGYVGAEPWRFSGADHVYTGESIGIRSRLDDHLFGDIRRSNLRETLLAIQHAVGALWDREPLNGASQEDVLTAWLVSNATVAYRYDGFVVEEERRLLKRTPSPLNIKGRSGPFVSLLKLYRRNYRVA